MPALKKGLSGLEPYEGKLSRTVLRGGSGGNITLLPGGQALNLGLNPNTCKEMGVSLLMCERLSANGDLKITSDVVSLNEVGRMVF